jgi:hypothetical protein
MPEEPPDLKNAPEKWKQAFAQLKAYAKATGLSKVIVKGATVTKEETPDGIVVRITVP